jgi:dolichol-phosphate mannosyltransferase
MLLSIIIPVYNEQENIKPLLAEIAQALEGIEHEVILVDDGSTDETKQEILSLAKKNLILVSFTRNFGQTSSMAAGIEVATGKYIALLDGDLQNDPSDIKEMLELVETGNYDLVAGRRKLRQDGMWLRIIPSKIANKIIRRFTKVAVNDFGCTLKLFKANLAKSLGLYGELHRFIPILADMNGAKIIEIDVNHRARKFGVSKYGIGRTFRVVSDLLLMLFFQKYKQKPMHLFGNLGILSFFVGIIIESYMIILKLQGKSIGTRPLFYLGLFFIIVAIQFITTGFMAEILVRTYYGSQKKKPYTIDVIYKDGKKIS